MFLARNIKIDLGPGQIVMIIMIAMLLLMIDKHDDS